MKLYITRHGQTQWNKNNLICGISDIELNTKGIEQANELALILKKYAIDVIYSSPLLRAKKTAEIISKELGIPVVIEQRLFEQDYGIYEGQDRSTEDFLDLKKQFAYTGAQNESLFHIAQRVYNFLDDIKEKEPDKNVLIVSHGGICRIINTYFNSMSNEEFFKFNQPNCSLMVFDL